MSGRLSDGALTVIDPLPGGAEPVRLPTAITGEMLDVPGPQRVVLARRDLRIGEVLILAVRVRPHSGSRNFEVLRFRDDLPVAQTLCTTLGPAMALNEFNEACAR